MKNILIVEDEIDINNLWRKNLQKFGYMVDSVYDGDSALEKIKKTNYSLIILDIMIPNIDGYSLCKLIKNINNNINIMIISSLSTGENVQKAFDCGADFYVKKPCSILELRSRIDNIFRKIKKPQSDEILSINGLILDSNDRIILKDNKKIHLSNTEYKILKLFFENPNNYITKQNIKDNVWNYEFDENNRIVEIYIYKIRQKIGHSRLISVRSKGYIIK